MPAGTATAASRPSSTESPAAGFVRLLLDVWAGNGGGGARGGGSCGYCLTYGRPTAAGGIERPMTPATAIRVRTYGSAWNRVAALPEYVGSRCASALEKPKRSAAAKAPPGRQRPKISAASAMKPRPAVMFWLNEWTKPIERYAPPSAARMPETTTAA